MSCLQEGAHRDLQQKQGLQFQQAEQMSAPVADPMAGSASHPQALAERPLRLSKGSARLPAAWRGPEPHKSVPEEPLPRKVRCSVSSGEPSVLPPQEEVVAVLQERQAPRLREAGPELALSALPAEPVQAALHAFVA